MYFSLTILLQFVVTNTVEIISQIMKASCINNVLCCRRESVCQKREGKASKQSLCKMLEGREEIQVCQWRQ